VCHRVVPRWLRRPSLLVAIAMMLAVPFATLEVPDVVAECCCPSPEVCRCPDHRGDATTHTSMRTCHRTSHHLAVSKLAAFVPAPPIAVIVPSLPARLEPVPPAQPLPAPFPRAPDVPS
jgi:hypothetical protein